MAYNAMVNRWACILATGFGCGRVPVAPGTVGSLLGVLVYLLLYSLSNFFIHFLILGFLFIVGVYASGIAEKAFGETDAKAIVIDEVCGMAGALLFLPKPEYLVAAFFLFRGFDILKPFPAGWVEQKMSGGLAIMLDDVVAAGYTVVVLMGIELVIA